MSNGLPSTIIPGTGAVPTTPALPLPGGRDIGVIRGRQVRVRRTVATSDTTAVAIKGSPYSWVEFSGLNEGFEFSFDGATWVEFDAGDMYPWPAEGLLLVRAQAGAVGTVKVREWGYEAGLMRASNRSTVRTITVTPAGKSTVPSSLGASARQALTTATPGTYTLGADALYAVVKAANANAAAAYVAGTSALVNVATTRFELGQGDFVTVYGASFGFLGTTGDYLYVQEFDE